MSESTQILASAIMTMREACDCAERYIEKVHPDEEKVARVLHDFAWGFANASSSIEYSIRKLKDQNAQR